VSRCRLVRWLKTPTTCVAAVAQRRAALTKLMTEWTALKAEARRLNLVDP
jgi:hypothetical protein